MQNPYDKNELREDIIENLFVGRKEEISEFFRTLDCGNNAFCIGGGFGVGKSSFLNKCIHKIKKEYRRDIIDTTPVDIITQETTQDFLRVISNYVGNAIYKESKSHEGWKDYQDIIDDLIGNQKTNSITAGTVKKYSLNDKIIRENIYYFTKARYNALSESEKKVLDKLMEIEEPLSPSDEKLQKVCNLTQSRLQRILS